MVNVVNHHFLPHVVFLKDFIVLSCFIRVLFSVNKKRPHSVFVNVYGSFDDSNGG